MMNLDDRDVMRDPYPHYQSMLEAGPIQFNTVMDKWQVTGHAEIKALSKRPELSSETVDAELSRLNRAERLAARVFLKPITDLSRNLLFIMDPPRHRRIRSLVTKVFVPARVEEMEPWTNTLAKTLMGRALQKRGGDFMADFAYPFPLAVIAQLLGVDALNEPKMRRWAHEVSAVFVKTRPTVAEALRGVRSTVMTRRFIRKELEKRWDSPPRDDLLGLLMAAREGSDQLTFDELVDTAILFLFAGHETTTNLLGNALMVLRDRPEIRDRMHDQPAFTAQVVEELLRFDPSVQNIERVVTTPFQFEGHHFKAGEQIILSLAAANRDPRVFDDPMTFRPGRKARHLTFGHGIHFCIGAALTRMEVRIALQHFVDSVAEYSTGNHQYRHSQAHRGLEALELRVQPRVAQGR